MFIQLVRAVVRGITNGPASNPLLTRGTVELRKVLSRQFQVLYGAEERGRFQSVPKGFDQPLSLVNGRSPNHLRLLNAPASSGKIRLRS